LDDVMLRQLHLSNFKCFNNHTVAFEKVTVLVGKNNAGKSTIVEALHLVAAAVNRKAATQEARLNNVKVISYGWSDRI
jgi:AAA15 family ATPase/GTPase